MTKIRARAPLRVSYAGGGTDVPPYPSLMGGVVLSSTIQNYAYCSIAPRSDGKITVAREDQDVCYGPETLHDLKGGGEVEFVRAVAKRFGTDQGFDASLRYDALPGTGLGSSSALCVSLIGAFREWKGNSMTDYDIANLAYDVERKDVGVPGGMQDQYASTFGGFNLIEFKKEATIVNALRIKRETLNELEYNSLLCFTGTTRRSGGILQRQIESYEHRNPVIMQALERMKELTLQMKDFLLTGNLRDFAEMLNAEWDIKKKLDQAISTEDVEKLLHVAKLSGAIGGKLLGAGGGGFLFLYCDSGKQVQVEKAVESLGAKAFPVRFDEDGLQTWRSPK
ncbi:MAG TPA: GHMP kinase [Candidatus Bathyarchaeia archaeon]|nr:GHMP kinase [Candidatus Bathyarchaeia archaeon]